MKKTADEILTATTRLCKLYQVRDILDSAIGTLRVHGDSKYVTDYVRGMRNVLTLEICAEAKQIATAESNGKVEALKHDSGKRIVALAIEASASEKNRGDETESEVHDMNNNQIDNTDYYRLPCGVYLEDFIHRFRLDFVTGSALKYLYRAGHKDNESKQKDLSKAKHYYEFIARKTGKDIREVISDIENLYAFAVLWDGETEENESTDYDE